MAQVKELGNLIDALRKDPESRLLVVGGKPSIFSEEIRNLERVTIWSSTEHSPKMCNADIPVRTKAIVFNKWIDHRLTANLRRESQRKGVPLCKHPLTPNTIVDLIKEAGLMPKNTEASVISDVPTVMGRGQLRTFIKQEADLRAPVGTEIPRLWALAQARGLPTTEASISTTFYSVRAAEVGIIRMRQKQDGTYAVRAIEAFSPLAEPFLHPAPEHNHVADLMALGREVRHALADADAATRTVREAEAAVREAEEAVREVEAREPEPVEIPAAAVEPYTGADLLKAIEKPAPPSTMETQQVLWLIDDAITSLQRLTGDATSALQLARAAIESIAPTLQEAAKLQAKIEKMRAFLNE
jgi:hypothetical protein